MEFYIDLASLPDFPFSDYKTNRQMVASVNKNSFGKIIIPALILHLQQDARC
jgi:hypothetical protein